MGRPGGKLLSPRCAAARVAAPQRGRISLGVARREIVAPTLHRFAGRCPLWGQIFLRVARRKIGASTIWLYFLKGQIMQTVPIHQAKNQLSSLIHAVEQGDSVFLTRHGKRVVQLSVVLEAHADTRHEAEISDALAKWQAFRDKVRPGPALDWKSLRDAGRKY